MKRSIRVVVFVIITILIFSYIYLNLQKNSAMNLEQPLNETSILSPTESIDYDPPEETTDSYKTEWLIVRDLEKIELISNLSDKRSSDEIMKELLCRNLVSGSFYTKDDNHIGLFISDSKRVSDAEVNSFFNSYFYLTDENATISQTPPTSAKFALQSGPLLIRDGKPVKLSIQNDSTDRRIAVATLRDGSVAFIVAYSANSLFKGPKLAEFPELLDKLQRDTSLNFKYVLNLDGGSAGAFITENAKLPELSRIGSYFCIK